MLMMSPRRSAASASLAACRRCSRDARDCARLHLGDPRAQPGVLEDRARSVPAQLGGDLVEHPLAPLDTADQADDGPVGLVLGERLLQQPMRLLGAHLVHQVDGHVVRRRERAAQREGPGGGQAGDRGRLGWSPRRGSTAPPRGPRRRCRAGRRGRSAACTPPASAARAARR